MDHHDGELIGTTRYVMRGADAVEIGWMFLARARWGGRWNGEMKRLVLQHAFASVPVLIVTVHEGNIRSQRAVEGLGAHRVRTCLDDHGRGLNVVFHLTRSMTTA